MGKEVLERRLDELCRQAMAEARAAVEQAPDGRWIAASEWQVRDIFQRLTRECYQAMLQAKADAHPAAAQAAFSPGGPAAEVGICRGDLLVTAGGVPARSEADVRAALATAAKRTALQLQFLRGETDVLVRLPTTH